MNAKLRRIVTMLQKDYTTIDVTFPSSTRHYTYKMPLSMKDKVAESNHVVVFAQGEFKVVDVVKIHDAPQIDPKATYEYRWIVCPVDTAAWMDLVDREHRAVKILEDAERQQEQERALEILLSMAQREELTTLLNPK